MPQLANQQHEAFAQAVVTGCSLTEAAKRSGHTVGPANFGSRLMERAEIAQRIIELEAAPREQPDADGKIPKSGAPSQNVLIYTDKAWVVTELVAIERLARKQKDISGMHACVKTLAQIGGLLDGNSRLIDPSRDPSRLALLGIKEIHTMLSQVVGQVPSADRRKLLAEAPELAELVGEVAEPTSEVVEDAASDSNNLTHSPD